MRLIFRAALAVAAVTLVGCGGPPTASLKGKLVDGDKPVSPGGLMMAVNFHPVKPDGTADPNVVYSAVVGGDGTFEFVASGGTLPPGNYRVVITAADAAGPPDPKKKKKAKSAASRFAAFSTVEGSKLTTTITEGANDVIVDLAKPNG